MKSNCLFEALKAKIKNPRNVRIRVLSADLAGEFHVYWRDLKEQSILHFTYLDPNEKGIMFTGKISRHNIDAFESKLYAMMDAKGWSLTKKRAYAKRKGFRNPEPFSIKSQK